MPRLLNLTRRSALLMAWHVRLWMIRDALRVLDQDIAHLVHVELHMPQFMAEKMCARASAQDEAREAQRAIAILRGEYQLQEPTT